eukprot:SAG31_NODE_108_length_24741_cov_6.933041_4_plen_156_part_00
MHRTRRRRAAAIHRVSIVRVVHAHHRSRTIHLWRRPIKFHNRYQVYCTDIQGPCGGRSVLQFVWTKCQHTAIASDRLQVRGMRVMTTSTALGPRVHGPDCMRCMLCAHGTVLRDGSPAGTDRSLFFLKKIKIAPPPPENKNYLSVLLHSISTGIT